MSTKYGLFGWKKSGKSFRDIPWVMPQNCKIWIKSGKSFRDIPNFETWLRGSPKTFSRLFLDFAIWGHDSDNISETFSKSDFNESCRKLAKSEKSLEKVSGDPLSHVSKLGISRKLFPDFFQILQFWGVTHGIFRKIFPGKFHENLPMKKYLANIWKKFWEILLGHYPNLRNFKFHLKS